MKLIALKDFESLGRKFTKDQVFEVCCKDVENRLIKLKQAQKYVEPTEQDNNTEGSESSSNTGNDSSEG